MKKLLILGAGREQLPAYKIAREMGYTVIGTDINPNAPAFKYADISYVVSTNDFEGNLHVAKKEKVNGIMTLISETAIPVLAKISDKLGLPGFSEDTAKKATNKNDMRKAMAQHNVPIPSVLKVLDIDEAISFAQRTLPPWVIKPSDSSGQRGITFTSKIEEISTALNEAKHFATDNAAAIEEYISGMEINVCAVVKNGETKILSLSNRVTLPSPNFGVAVTHIAPAIISKFQKEQVEKISVNAINAIGLKDGIAYPQIIVNEDKACLVEIAARIPGGNMREIAMHLSGIDMIRVAILQAMGEDYNFETIKTEMNYPSVYVRHITEKNVDIGNDKVETITGINEVLELEGIKDCFMHLKKGERVPKLECGVQRFGAITAVGESFEETYSLIEKAFATIKINGNSLIDYKNYHPSYYEFIK